MEAAFCEHTLPPRAPDGSATYHWLLSLRNMSRNGLSGGQSDERLCPKFTGELSSQVRITTQPLVSCSDEEPCSLSTSALRISGALSVRACPEFVCLLRHLPRYKNIPELFSQNSPTVLMLPSQTQQGLPSLPCQLRLPPAHAPALPRGAVACLLTPARTCLASSFLSALSLPSAAARFFAAFRIHLLSSSLCMAPSKQPLSL